MNAAVCGMTASHPATVASTLLSQSERRVPVVLDGKQPAPTQIRAREARTGRSSERRQGRSISAEERTCARPPRQYRARDLRRWRSGWRKSMAPDHVAGGAYCIWHWMPTAARSSLTSCRPGYRRRLVGGAATGPDRQSDRPIHRRWCR